MSRADLYMPEELPYKGLIPYYEEDRLFFFGRERKREDITDELKASRLTVLYGASGVGKSSVLRAGVAYHLRQEAKNNVDTTGKAGQAIIVFPPPFRDELADEVSWQDPLNGIKKQLEREIANLLDVSQTEIKEKFEAEITSLYTDVPSPPKDRSLVDTLKAWANILQDEDGRSRLFIILDQFEEYLVQLRHKKTDNAFLDEFQKAVNSSEVRINFLISIREDSLASLDHLVNIQDRFKNLLAIEHLNAQSAREAIQKPIFEYNRQKIILEKFLDDSRLTILAGNRDTHKSTILRSAITHYLRENRKNRLNVVFFNGWGRSQEQDLLDVFKMQLVKDLDRVDALSPPQSELSLIDTLSTWIKHIDGKQSETRLFVILDQFEEYFWNQEERDRDQKFINELLSAINDNSLNIKFFIAIRDDWLFDLIDVYKDRLPDSCQYYLKLNPINTEGNNLIEEKPIDPNIMTPNEEKELQQKLKEQFITIENIEPNLDYDILEAFKQQDKERVLPNHDIADRGSESETELKVEAPILQLVMTRLWDKEKESGSKYLRRETFQQLHGIEGIVDEHFRGKRKRLSHGELDIAARIFPYLVTQSGMKIPLHVRDLLYYDKQTKPKYMLEREQVENLLNKLSDIESSKEKENYRILRSVPGIGGESRYEIFHDMLAQPILAWLTEHERKKRIEEGEKEKGKKIKEGEKEKEKKIKEGKLIKEKAEKLAKKYEEQANRAEERRRSTVRRMSISVTGSVIIAVGSMVWASNIYIGSQINRIDGAVSQFDQAAKIDFFESGQLMALERAMRVRNELTEPLNALKLIPFVKEQYTKAKNDLQTILKNIKEKNQLQVNSPVLNVRFSSDGKNLAIVSTDGIVRLWNWEGDKELGELNTKLREELKGYRSDVLIARFNFEENTLATFLTDGTIRLFNLQDSELKQINSFKVIDFKERIGGVSSISFSSNGQDLATGYTDGTVRLWNLQGKRLAELKGHQDAVVSVSFSPNGQDLATGYTDGTVRLWNLQGKRLAELKGHQDAVVSVSFSPNGQDLATGYTDGTVRLWNLQGKQLAELKGHKGAVVNVSFSPNGQDLATGYTDGTVRLWNLQSKQSDELKGHQGAVKSVSFSPNGQYLASGGSASDPVKSTVRLWSLQEKPRWDEESLDELLDHGCVWLKYYIATHPNKQEELSEECPNPSLNDK